VLTAQFQHSLSFCIVTIRSWSLGKVEFFGLELKRDDKGDLIHFFTVTFCWPKIGPCHTSNNSRSKLIKNYLLLLMRETKFIRGTFEAAALVKLSFLG